LVLRLLDFQKSIDNVSRRKPRSVCIYLNEICLCREFLYGAETIKLVNDYDDDDDDNNSNNKNTQTAQTAASAKI